MLTAHLVRADDGLKRCIKPTTEMTQGEWDVLHDFARQYGVPTTCKSSIGVATSATSINTEIGQHYQL